MTRMTRFLPVVALIVLSLIHGRADGGGVLHRYVNAVCGNDSNSGQDESCAAGTNGPKRTIFETMASISDNSKVIIHLAAGTYVENSAIVIDESIQVRIEGNGATVQNNTSNTLFLYLGHHGFGGYPYSDIFNLEIEGGGNDGSGGAIRVEGGAQVNLNTVTIRDVTAQFGGGVYVKNGCKLRTINCSFIGNHATSQGGAIFMENGGTLDLSADTFTDNTSVQGAAIFAGTGSVNLTQCEFLNNDASFAAALHSDGTGTISRCRFADNDSTWGGAVRTEQSADHKFVNCEFRNNTASGGSAILGRGDVELINCTLRQNNGWAYFNDLVASTLVARNCIFWNGSEILVQGGSADVTHSDVFGGYPGTSNIDANPLFAADGVSLLPGSPCLDSGLDSVDAGDYDIDANLRRQAGRCTGNIWDDSIDMGAHERQFSVGSTLYVDGSQFAHGGLSWAAPTTPDLAFAFAVAAQFPATVNHIWVKEGTYKPDSGTDERTRSFVMPNDVGVYGGFDANNPENNKDNRDPAARSTLSGNIGDGGMATDNSYRVLTAATTTLASVMNQFIIEDGYANGGGGPTTAAGVNSAGSTSFRLEHCDIRDNYASDWAGGIYAGTGTSLYDCRITGNIAAGTGGGGALTNGTPLFRRTVFSGNSGSQGGGVFVNGGAGPRFHSCLFYNNTGSNSGGGIWCHQGSTPEIINCTITNNGGGSGDGIYTFGSGAPALTNTIVYANGNQDIGGTTAANGTANNCCIGPDVWNGAGGSNINTDPQFVNAGAFDYHIGVYSPCLDAGDDTVSIGSRDLSGDPSSRRFDGVCGADSWQPGPGDDIDIIDIGAWEGAQWDMNLLTLDEDCNDNDFPDDCEAEGRIAAIMDELTNPQLSLGFRAGFPTYQSILAAYGRPWAPGHGQDPTYIGNPANPTEYDLQPARILLEVALQGLCAAKSDELLREVSDMFMLLGNEAFSDALDSTVGLGGGIDLGTVGDFFAFDGVSGINSLLDEELALLRGREINDDFSNGNEAVNYPETDGPDSFRAAIYNRLPHNADGIDDGNLAYRNTYGAPNSNEAAAMEFPQGHGDAYGYYLSAVKAYTQSFTDSDVAPYLINLQPNDIEEIMTGASPAPIDVPFRSVRMMAEAMAARARAASQIVDRTFRRNYEEGAANPGVDIAEYGQPLQLPETDPARAWKMADWASRSAMGSYLDWALVNHLVPERDPNLLDGQGYDLQDVNRQNMDEIDQLIGAVAEMQSRVDWAAAGRNPLGLADDVIPFGIDSGLLTNFIENNGGGLSHYEQVRVPAEQALRNASVVLGWANESGQRMREAAEANTEFGDWIAEQEIAYDNQLIEIYGLPSIDDPADNDLDGLTEAEGDDESQKPDLVNFLFSDDDFAGLGVSGRLAPGAIQIAMSEILIAQIRLQQAQAVLSALSGDISHLRDDIEQRRDNNQQVIDIIWESASKMISLEDRMEELAVATFETDELGIGLGILGDVVGAATDCFGDATGAQCAGILIATGASSAIGAVQAERAAKSEQEKVEAEFDIARERINVTAWQDASLAGIEGDNEVMDMARELEGLIRQTPQVMLEIGSTRQQLSATIGQLAAAVSRGERLQADRERLRKTLRDQLESYRHTDLAFRIYRNDSLQKYRGFYDLAAKYVMLAARSFAYEYNARASVEELLAGIHKETRLGSDPVVNLTGGLWGTIAALNDLAGSPPGFEMDPKERAFSLRTNLLGLPAVIGSPEDEVNKKANIAFRSWLESNIVQQFESVSQIERYVELSSVRDYGPAIVIPLSTNIGSTLNFYGQSGDEYGGAQFVEGYRTNNVLTYQMRFENAGLNSLVFPTGRVSMFVIPLGESMFRAPDTGSGQFEDSPVRGWRVVNQNLRQLAPVNPGEPWEGDESYSAWVDLANGGGFPDYNSIKRFQRSEGHVPQIAPGNPSIQSDRAGWTAWNTRWLLAIPGGRLTTDGFDPDLYLRKLMIFIYGEDPGFPGEPAPPEMNLGITDIDWQIQGYRRDD